MVSITVSLEPKLREGLKKFNWINWSEVGREEILKKEIFERYIENRKLTDRDWNFCEKIDWHPVDELPLKESFIKKLKNIRKERPIRFNSVDELFKEIK
tara:strand:+ start:2259 stop:2555 length:297 start_codon:yes stop_codon:yes gene_type:complete